MGNLPSCANGAFRVWHSDETGSAGAAAPITQALVKVLLVDGGVLHFAHPVKVISLLLHYPHHSICPLDSLQPAAGHLSLSSLLPDEELQVGRLYLLLPFAHHTSSLIRPSSSSSVPDRSSQFPANDSPIISLPENSAKYGDGSFHFSANESPIISPAPNFRKSGNGLPRLPAEESPIIAPVEAFRNYGDGSFPKESTNISSAERFRRYGDGSPQFPSNQLPTISSAESFPKYGDGFLPFPSKDSPIISSVHRLDDNGDGALSIPAQRSQNCDDYDDGSVMTLAKESRTLGERTRLLARNMSEINRCSSSFASCNGSRKRHKGGAKPDVDYCISASLSSLCTSHSCEEKARPVLNISRLCDTPELQRAYRSAMLRRCGTWAPRLQAINEVNASRRTNAA